LCYQPSGSIPRNQPAVFIGATGGFGGAGGLGGAATVAFTAAGLRVLVSDMAVRWLGAIVEPSAACPFGMTQSLPSTEDFTGWPTVEDIDDYFTLIGNGDWLTITDAEKDQSRAKAILALETLEWNGDRADEDQGWSWPRINITCKGVTATADYVPHAIVQALSELAYALYLNPEALVPTAPAGDRWTKREKLDVLEVEYAMLDRGPSKMGSPLPLVIQKFPWLRDFLSCWANLGGSAVRLYRN
jgi:hypothetical protein